MEDIRLVIKLSEEDYTEICKCAYPNDLLVGELVYQVRNNTPLPNETMTAIKALKAKPCEDTIYYDMTEWSDEINDVVAYAIYEEPEPYKEGESE